MKLSRLHHARPGEDKPATFFVLGFVQNFYGVLRDEDRLVLDAVVSRSARQARSAAFVLPRKGGSWIITLSAYPPAPKEFRTEASTRLTMGL